MRALIVSVHDVAPATMPETNWWLDRLESLGLTTSLLVVAGPWRGSAAGDDPSFRRWVDEKRSSGHEIVLHGWTHLQAHSSPWARVMARGAAEFAGVDLAEARRKLDDGIGVMGDLGVERPGFTPPGWILPSPALDAARGAGLAYATTHFSIFDFQRGVRHHIPVICHRPGSRLALAGAQLVRQGAQAISARGRPVRLAIHPGDTREPALVATTIDVIDQALERGVPVLSYAQFLEAA